MPKKYLVMNLTDGILASLTKFSEEEADQFIKDFPLRYERQGYYKTADCRRIDPAQVVLKKELYSKEIWKRLAL